MEKFSLKGDTTRTQKIEFQIDHEDIKLITLTFESKDRYWLNANLYDPKGRLRGQIVYPKEQANYYLSTHDETTSDSFIAGDLPMGLWYIEYALAPKDDLDLNLTIQSFLTDDNINKNIDRVSWLELGDQIYSFAPYLKQISETTKPEEKWYRGDFHTHTIETDGQMTIDDNQEQALKMKLDFYVATDHNVTPTKWHKANPIVYPGLELTSHLGHCNLLFINHMIFESFPLADIFSEKSFLEVMKKKHPDDFLLSINHPFLTIWKWLVKDLPLSEIDSIEIINDPTYEDNISANLATLAFWDLLLQDGHQITVIGGSDSHLRPDDRYPNSQLASLIGDPATLVYSKSLSPEHMMESIRRGHVMVSRLGDFEFSVDGHISGSKLDWQAGKEYQVSYKYQTWEDFDVNDLHLEIVQDGQVIHTTNDLQGTCLAKLNNERVGYSWLRVQVIHHSLGLVAVANPVYFGEKMTSYQTWGDTLQDFHLEVK